MSCLYASREDAKDWDFLGSRDQAVTRARAENWPELWEADPEMADPARYVPDSNWLIDQFEESVCEDLPSDREVFRFADGAAAELAALLKAWATKNCTQTWFQVANIRRVAAYFRAGDTVHNQPSGEDWVLACDEYQEHVMPAGWPESREKVSDCELIEAASDELRLQMLKDASAGSGVRADLAQRQLTAERGQL